MNQNLSAQAFANPGAPSRVAPFWFWNCDMSPQRVSRQVRLMAEAGCGGFFIHARQGLSLPYLSRGWFERVRLAVEEAGRLGLEAWLYDEFPHPSGIAGGLLTAARPEMKARVLRHLDWPAQGRVRREMPLGRLVCALAVPLEDGPEDGSDERARWDEALDLREDVGVVLSRELFWLRPMGHSQNNEKRFMGDEGRLVLEAELPPGRWKIFVAIEREQEGFKYFGCFFDSLHPEAAPLFLQMTHERYRKYLGEHFGRTIPGIFTDETEPPLWSPHIEEALRGAFAFEHDLKQHFIFHIVDAQALLGAQERGGGLELGLARYHTVIVPPGCEGDEEARAAIEKARHSGLQVLGEGWAAALEGERALSVRGGDGRQAEAVWAAWREAGEGSEQQEIVFLANTGGSAVEARVEVREGVARWERWSLEDGSVQPLESSAGEAASTCSVRLEALGSALLVGSRAKLSHPAAPAATPRAAPRVAALPLEGEWDLALDRPNALRLNRWRAACAEGDWSGEADDSGWAQAEALPLRYWDAPRGGWQQPVARREGVPLWYRRAFECEAVPQDAAILIEDGAILGSWALWVNGQAVPREAFGRVDLNGSDKAQASIGPLLKRGENILALQVEEAPEMGGLRTPLHLVGSFGVRGLSSRTLVELPARAPFNDLEAALCPHFSGVATYSRLLDAQAWAQRDEISLPDGFGLVAQVWLGGHEVGTRAWSPYRFELPLEMREARGMVEVRIAVANTLLPFYEGQQWDAPSHSARGV